MCVVCVTLTRRPEDNLQQSFLSYHASGQESNSGFRIDSELYYQSSVLISVKWSQHYQLQKASRSLTWDQVRCSWAVTVIIA